MASADHSADCAYCGLPLSASTRGTASNGRDQAAPSEISTAPEQVAVEPRYCCYGCRFAATVTQASGEVGQARGLMIRLGLSLFFSMNVMAFTMFLWTQEGNADQPAAAVFYDIGRYVCLLFTTPLLLLLAGPLVEDAWSELRRGRPSLSGLLVIGVLAAFAYSVASVIRGSGHVYFEVSCMVLVAVTLGRWMEAQGKLQTTAALRALQRLLPDEVRRIVAGVETFVDRRLIVRGDTVRVLAGERIAVDGRIERGVASIDQQAVTGESVAVVKLPGELVYSGTLNLDGELLLDVTANSEEGTMQRIIAAVASAVTRNDRYQRLADKISAWFLPVVLTIAAATFAVHAWRSGFADGLLAALAVVVIACPCALGLATPMALWAAVGRAARRQVLLREGDCLDRLANATLFCFDKTGTLTTGVPRVDAIDVAAGESREEVLRVAAALAQASTHPLSQSLVAWLQSANATPLDCRDVRTEAGRCLWAAQVGADYFDVCLGSERLLTEQLSRQEHDPGNAALAEFGERSADGPVVGVAWNGRIRGVIRFVESLRPSAPPSIRWLVEDGRRVQILTGDHARRAERLAATLGVPVLGDQLPAEKLAWIEEHRAHESVVMIGDGINDAPALAAADVGIALGCGTDIARHTAAVCLLGNDLERVGWLTDLARRTVSTIRWNLFWAFAYNIVGIGIAVTGWLNPIVAAIAMAASSLLVVSNSLKLARDDDDAVASSSPSGFSETEDEVKREGEVEPTRSTAPSLSTNDSRAAEMELT